MRIFAGYSDSFFFLGVMHPLNIHVLLQQFVSATPLNRSTEFRQTVCNVVDKDMCTCAYNLIFVKLRGRYYKTHRE